MHFDNSFYTLKFLCIRLRFWNSRQELPLRSVVSFTGQKGIREYHILCVYQVFCFILFLIKVIGVKLVNTII